MFGAVNANSSFCTNELLLNWLPMARQVENPSTAVERTLLILEAVAQREGGMSNADFSRKLKIPKSSASYILRTLEQHALSAPRSRRRQVPARHEGAEPVARGAERGGHSRGGAAHHAPPGGPDPPHDPSGDSGPRGSGVRGEGGGAELHQDGHLDRPPHGGAFHGGRQGAAGVPRC